MKAKLKSKIIPRFGYLVMAVGVALGSLTYVRYGALTIALGLALFAIPFIKENWQQRRIEAVICIAIVVALVTIAMVLPSSNV